jgi:hypothetical protein
MEYVARGFTWAPTPTNHAYSIVAPGNGVSVGEGSHEGETMNAYPDDVGAEIEAYAAYLNAPRGLLDSDEQLLFDQDLLKARAAMERAWLEAKPVREPG